MSRGESPRPGGRASRSFADQQVHGGIEEKVNLAEKVKTARGVEQRNLTGQEQGDLWKPLDDPPGRQGDIREQDAPQRLPGRH